MKYHFTYKPVEKLPQTLGAFLRYIVARNPVLWAVYFFQDIIHFSRSYVIFFLLGIIIDRLMALPAGASIPSDIWWMVAGGGLYFAFGELMHVWATYHGIYWKPFIRTAVRTDFLNHTLGHSANYLNNNFAGSLTRKITEAAGCIERLHDLVRFRIGYGIETLLFTAVILFAVSPLYACVCFLFGFAIALPLLWRIKRVSGLAKELADQRAQVTGVIVDSLTNGISVKSFARDTHEMSQHKSVSQDEEKAYQRLHHRTGQLGHLRRLAITLFSSGMLVFCLLGWQNGLISLGDVATIMGASMSLLGNAWIFSDGIVQFFDESGNITDALKIINVPHEIEDKAGANPLSVSDGHIHFKNIVFAYNKNGKVFENLNLEVQSGEKIGLLGPSGAGKSTLIHLLLRFYDLEKNKIIIDGQNIADVTQNSLRKQIAVIPQDTSLFHRSLIENIRYGRLEASDEDVIEAAKKAHAHEFISELPDGYKTLVGERGVKLSGGQRQRIAIARAILKDAPILILDEATSALDSESEKLIQESLKELMEGKTVIAIAHRLSTIAHLDRLIVMDQGRIVEDGTHEALLKSKGLYAKLWGMQSGGFLGE